MNALRIDSPTEADHGALVSLSADVIASRPAYARDVASGRENAADWFFRKPVDWSRVARVDDVVVAHGGVKDNDRLPDGSNPPTGHDRELCRLMVHPRQQRTGIASMLVDAAVAEYGTRLWATVLPGGASHRLLAGRGWQPAHEAWFPDAGTFGLVICSTERAA